METRTQPSVAPVVNLTYNDVTITPAIANAYATDLYGDVLFRAPDAAGLGNWDQQMNSGQATAPTCSPPSPVRRNSPRSWPQC